jgi:hypothetical protein
MAPAMPNPKPNPPHFLNQANLGFDRLNYYEDYPAYEHHQTHVASNYRHLPPPNGGGLHLHQGYDRGYDREHDDEHLDFYGHHLPHGYPPYPNQHGDYREPNKRLVLALPPPPPPPPPQIRSPISHHRMVSAQHLQSSLFFTNDYEVDLNDPYRASSMQKCRQLPCRTWISTGSCPYGDRCVFIHDPRVIAKPPLSKGKRKSQEDLCQDSLFWPTMSRESVSVKLDNRNCKSTAISSSSFDCQLC